MCSNDNRDSNNLSISCRNAEMRYSGESDKNLLPCSPVKKDETMVTTGSAAPSKRLEGIFRIGGQRNFTFPLKNKEYFLTCKRFWCDDRSAICLTEEGVNLMEIFTICNNENFLQKVCNSYLLIELSKINTKLKNNIIGVLRLSLHQFFIGFRDANITNRLCKDQFPVLSTDAWVPILDLSTGEKVGEVECLLAIGTKEQIENLQISINWKANKLISQESPNQEYTFSHQSFIKPSISNESSNRPMSEAKPAITTTYNTNTSVLFNMLQKSSTPPTHEEENSNADSFRIFLEIKSARGLPLNPFPKKQKKVKNNSAVKGIHVRFPPGEEPNTYVTFQANEGHGPMVKSHEGMVYSTTVMEKTSNPIWNKSFYPSLALDYIMNKKRFILKIWKKCKSIDPSKALPCPLEDLIVGFASIDFTNFPVDAPLTRWLNITDFNGHVTGQIQVTIQILDDLKKLSRYWCQNQVDSLLNSFESSLNMNNINIGRTIKRKFVELEEISQRLKARLLDVTDDSDRETDMEMNDDELNQFELDINTIANEEENDTDYFFSQVNSSFKNT